MEEKVEEVRSQLGNGGVGDNKAGWVCKFYIIPLVEMIIKAIREIEKKFEIIESSIKKTHSSCCFDGNCWDNYVLAVTKELESGKEVVCQTRMGLNMTLKGRVKKELSSIGRAPEEYREFIKRILED